MTTDNFCSMTTIRSLTRSKTSSTRLQMSTMASWCTQSVVKAAPAASYASTWCKSSIGQWWRRSSSSTQEGQIWRSEAHSCSSCSNGRCEGAVRATHPWLSFGSQFQGSSCKQHQLRTMRSSWGTLSSMPRWSWAQSLLSRGTMVKAELKAVLISSQAASVGPIKTVFRRLKSLKRQRIHQTIESMLLERASSKRRGWIEKLQYWTLTCLILTHPWAKSRILSRLCLKDLNQKR